MVKVIVFFVVCSLNCGVWASSATKQKKMAVVINAHSHFDWPKGTEIDAVTQSYLDEGRQKNFADKMVQHLNMQTPWQVTVVDHESLSKNKKQKIKWASTSKMLTALKKQGFDYYLYIGDLKHCNDVICFTLIDRQGEYTSKKQPRLGASIYFELASTDKIKVKTQRMTTVKKDILLKQYIHSSTPYPEVTEINSVLTCMDGELQQAAMGMINSVQPLFKLETGTDVEIIKPNNVNMATYIDADMCR